MVPTKGGMLNIKNDWTDLRKSLTIEKVIHYMTTNMHPKLRANAVDPVDGDPDLVEYLKTLGELKDNLKSNVRGDARSTTQMTAAERV